jgi:hypothetical protein
MKTAGIVRTFALLWLFASVYSCSKIYAPEYDNNIEEGEDYFWDSSDETIITLKGTSAVVAGEGATVSGNEVLITAGGNYRVSGILDNGRIVIDNNDQEIIRLILDGVSITSNSSSAIFVRKASKVVMVLEAGTENSLTDGSSYNFDDQANKEPSGTIYSKSYLGISGTGSLNVTGRFSDGIVGKDGLVIKEGTITVNAVDDGIRGKDYLMMHDGDLVVNSGDDGLKSDVRAEFENGSIRISAGDDAIHTDSILIIKGGTIDIARSYEGLESISLIISGGNIHVVSSDDGLNAADGSGGGGMPGMPPQGGFSSGKCTLKITGGYICVNATGDGIDINGSVEMTGGTLIIDGPTASNNGALDYDGACKVTGGTILAIGSSGMAQAPGTNSTQCSLLINFALQQAAGTLVTLTDNSGTVVFSAKNSKKFQSVVFCSPLLKIGSAYDVYLAGLNSGELIDGIYSGGVYSPGTRYKSFTVSGILTQVR